MALSRMTTILTCTYLYDVIFFVNIFGDYKNHIYLIHLLLQLITIYHIILTSKSIGFLSTHICGQMWHLLVHLHSCMIQ
jgi:hypothetical protein